LPTLSVKGGFSGGVLTVTAQGAVAGFQNDTRITVTLPQLVIGMSDVPEDVAKILVNVNPSDLAAGGVVSVTNLYDTSASPPIVVGFYLRLFNVDTTAAATDVYTFDYTIDYLT
jgi:hypothetical protein